MKRSKAHKRNNHVGGTHSELSPDPEELLSNQLGDKIVQLFEFIKGKQHIPKHKEYGECY